METQTKSKVRSKLDVKEASEIDELEAIDPNSFKSFLKLTLELTKRPDHRWKFVALFSVITLVWGPILYVTVTVALILVNFVLIVLQKLL